MRVIRPSGNAALPRPERSGLGRHHRHADDASGGSDIRDRPWETISLGSRSSKEGVAVVAVSEMEFTDRTDEEVRVAAAPRSGSESKATGSASPHTETTPSAAAVASFDMVVIGAGPAGEKAAAQAAFFGKRVAIVERAARRSWSAARGPDGTLRETALPNGVPPTRGLRPVHSPRPRHDADRLMDRTPQVQAAMVGQVRENIARHQIEMVPGTGSFGPNRTVVVTPGGTDAAPRTLQADIVLIATGSRPFHAPDVPFDDPDVYDSERILGIDRIPRSMVVVGGGPVGCEYSSIFTSLGTEVVLLDSGERLLPFVDGEISRLLGATFSSMGVRLVLGSGVGAVRRADGELQVILESGEVIRPEKVLFAAGRAGNTEGLGLEEVSVQIDARGRIVVDESSERPRRGSTRPATSSAPLPLPRSRWSREGSPLATPSASRSKKRLIPSRRTASTPSPRWPWSA